jgi:hypothetical protein
VKPDVLFRVHRHSNDGVVEQRLLGKFASRNEMKHVCAHDGIMFVISLDREYVPEEDEESAALLGNGNAYIRARRLAGRKTMLQQSSAVFQTAPC